MPTCCFPSARIAGFALVCAVAARAAGDAPALTVDEQGPQLTVSFPGTTAEAGQPAIPSWKAVLRRDDGGNITALHVPAEHPVGLGSRGFWSLTVLALRNSEGLEGMMSRGRENYAAFEVERFVVAERGPARVVVEIGGPSKHRFVDHTRTYTFTPGGVAIAGEIVTRVALASVAFDPHWDLNQIADSHALAVPIRTQGRHGWLYLPSSGRDAVTPLPAGVDYPLEVELRLRRERPTFVRTFWDKTFDSHEGKRLFGHNNKEYTSPSGKTYQEKLLLIAGDPVARGQRETYQVRYVFETR